MTTMTKARIPGTQTSGGINLWEVARSALLAVIVVYGGIHGLGSLLARVRHHHERAPEQAPALLLPAR